MTLNASGGGLAANSDQDETAAADALRATERERVRALREVEMAVAERLHADDYQLVTPAGMTFSKREYLHGIASRALRYTTWEAASPMRVRLADQMAAARYQCHIEMRFADGGDSGDFRHIDLYEGRSGLWRAVWSLATRIPSQTDE